MKKLILFAAIFVFFAITSTAETVVWEAENGMSSGYISSDSIENARNALRYGDSGNEVIDLQSRLAELGYFEAEITGGYYDKTRKAVRSFQKQNSLKADGIAGEKTQDKLFSDSAIPSWGKAKYKLMVDVTNQITRAYTYDQTGEYTVLIREMVCSTGTKQYPTPLGTFIMPKKRARWGFFPQWDSHAQYLTRIDNENAFHSVLYSTPNESALNVLSFMTLGSRQSHGCVRLTVSDAKWIFENCNAGTIITIFEKGISDQEYPTVLKQAIESEKSTSLAKIYAQAAASENYRLLKHGEKGIDVYMVQMRLFEFGYYNDMISGEYNDSTKAAVKAFQKDYGLTVDGVAGQQTQSVLFGIWK